MDRMIKECDDLMKSLGNMPFEEALPILERGFREIGSKYSTSGIEAFKMYIEWKQKQQS